MPSFGSFLAINSVNAPYVVKPEDLSLIDSALQGNMAVIVPWGLGILALILGIRFIPRLIKMWVKG